MRAIIIAFVILLLIALAVPAAFAVGFWMDQRALVARAEQNGVLRQPTNGFNTVERTIAINEFSQTWAMRAFPCRTADLLWTDITASDVTPPGMPISQRYATALLSGQHGTSIRWQLQRLVVACQLEQRFNDTQMFRTWLSTASFGQNLRGVESAAQAVFAKPASALDAEESAKLAALLRAPGLRSQPERWAQVAQAIRERVAEVR